MKHNYLSFLLLLLFPAAFAADSPDRTDQPMSDALIIAGNVSYCNCGVPADGIELEVFLDQSLTMPAIYHVGDTFHVTTPSSGDFIFSLPDGSINGPNHVFLLRYRDCTGDWKYDTISNQQGTRDSVFLDICYCSNFCTPGVNTGSDSLIIFGNITDDMGNPVEGADVIAYLSHALTSPVIYHPADTFSFTTTPCGDYVIIFPQGSVSGPNHVFIVEVEDCPGAPLYDTISNNQGTVDCAQADFELMCEPMLSVAGEKGKPQITLFPNPVSDRLYISSASAVEQVMIYDVYGRLVFSAQAMGENPMIHTEFLKSGYYILSAVTGDGISRSVFIKQ